MTPQAELNAAAELMAARLRIFKKSAQFARERGEEEVTLAPAELWESGDEFALASFDLAKERLTGAQRLPMEIPTETPEESEELDRIERTSPAVMHPLGETA